MTRPAEPDYQQQLLCAALVYAKQGWRIFPLRAGSKKPAVPSHPAHLCHRTDPKCADGHTGWEQRATTDPDRITRAWTRRPYGIGIACGPSRLLVVDLDTASEGGPSGAETWSRLTHRHPVTVTTAVVTPSGGRHLYYQLPAGVDLGNTASKLGPRIDTRAAGGYVVAPPTQLGDDGAYWITCGTPPAPAPGWLLDALAPRATDPIPEVDPQNAGGRHHVRSGQPAGSVAVERARRYVEAALEGEARRLQTATAQGTRNHSLFLAAIALGQLVGADLLDEHTAERVLWANTGHHLASGAYTRSEAAATIASGLTRGKAEPRRLPTELTGAHA